MLANNTYTASRLYLFLSLLPAYQAWVGKRLAGNIAGRNNPKWPKGHLISYDFILTESWSENILDFKEAIAWRLARCWSDFFSSTYLVSVPFPFPLSFHILINLYLKSWVFLLLFFCFFPDPTKGEGMSKWLWRNSTTGWHLPITTTLLSHTSFVIYIIVWSWWLRNFTWTNLNKF